MSGETFLTADPRLFHPRVAELRGFDTVADHNVAICENWIAHVRPRDTVIVAGDVALGNVSGALAIMAALPGIKHLVSGNHDGTHPMHQRSHQMARRYIVEGGFEWVASAARRKVADRDLLISHFPYARDHTATVRYQQWRLPDLGEWLAHGHLHSKVRLTSDHEIHIGLDAWDLAPVPLAAVAELMNGARP